MKLLCGFFGCKYFAVVSGPWGFWGYEFEFSHCQRCESKNPDWDRKPREHAIELPNREQGDSRQRWAEQVKRQRF